MALRIFETDPDAKPRKRTPQFEAPVFRISAGMQKNNKPLSLSTWRVTTGEPDVADALAQELGGSVEEYDPSKEMNLQVISETDSIEVVLSGRKAIEDKMVLWGRSGPIHECDGVTFLGPDDVAGTPCGCPKSLADRKAAAKSGRGPAPYIQTTFRLAGRGYDLGFGKFVSSSWGLATEVGYVTDALENVEGEALCKLRLELVEFTTKSGVDVSYRKPIIEVLGSYNDAVAEPRD